MQRLVSLQNQSFIENKARKVFETDKLIAILRMP